MIKTREELIKKYIEFFESKKHRRIPSASLIPENDPTVLFTTAGMHPLVPFLLGQKYALGKRVVSVQKCIRLGDIEEVGDEVHHTFFEMLGNWSFGDYFKEDAIKFSFEFLTDKKWLGLNKHKLAVTCFAGDSDAKRDDESASVWKSLGISERRIAFLGKKDNWWGPAGETGPCGPDSEMFYWTGKENAPEKFEAKDKRWVEIWNDVFMQYEKKKRIILVDGIGCLYDEWFKINEELMNVLQKFNAKKILVINNHKERAEEILSKYGFEVFSFNGKITKDNPEFFERLLSHFKLNADELIYFEHKKENVESARKVGITNSISYSGNTALIEEFIKNRIGYYVLLKQKNVDTGMGVERTLAVLNGVSDNYLTDSFKEIILEIEKISGKKYFENKREMRVIADHIRAATFILGDERGVAPGNVGQGYVLRRLIRRAVRYGKLIGIENNFLCDLAKIVILKYGDYYSELKGNENFILSELKLEEERFIATLDKGLRKFSEIVANSDGKISGKNAFLLFQSYGFPIEMSVEMARGAGKNVDVLGFNDEYRKHQELSRTTSAGSFKSGLADDSEKTTRLHTATHLLNEALRRVLGKEVKQKGSNINSERLRFDFNFSRKLSDDELREIESLVNEIVDKRLDVVREEMTLKDAINSGAQAEFGTKYPDVVSVYTVVDGSEKKKWFSREICTGPHVSKTSEIGRFKILKEESVAAGVRRIKATVE